MNLTPTPTQRDINDWQQMPQYMDGHINLLKMTHPEKLLKELTGHLETYSRAANRFRLSLFIHANIREDGFINRRFIEITYAFTGPEKTLTRYKISRGNGIDYLRRNLGQTIRSGRNISRKDLLQVLDSIKGITFKREPDL